MNNQNAQLALKGNWLELKGNVTKKWGKLTDNDVAQINGNSEILAGKLMQNYAMSKEDAEKEIERFCKKS